MPQSSQLVRRAKNNDDLRNMVHNMHIRNPSNNRNENRYSQQTKLDFNAHLHPWDQEEPKVPKEISRKMRTSLAQNPRYKNSSIGNLDVYDREV